MPYIPRAKRPQFVPYIEKIVSTILEEKDSVVRAEYIGFFIEDVIKALDSHITSNHNNSVFLDNTRREIIRDCNSKLGLLIASSSDLFTQAGELNFVMSGVIWGVLGDAINATPAGYGFRAMVKGYLHLLADRVADSTFRSRIILRGVLTDVIDEMYRRKTAVYEDQKITQNGDVYPLRDISWRETAPIEPLSDDNDCLDLNCLESHE